MRILDLFCGAGGASMGYHQAGFDVVGVDIEPQPDYPFEFHRIDVMGLDLTGPWDFIHASPPCQHDCTLTVGTNAARGVEYPNLTAAVQTRLQACGLPYCIENPPGRTPLRADLMLCGEMFALDVIRHRVFELGGFTMVQPEHIRHRGRVRGWRHGVWHDGPYVAAYGAGGGKASVAEMQAAMQLGWTANRRSLTEAIPPAYTRYIAGSL
jgi:hypothetical protein